MAQDLLVGEQLSSDMIESGARLVAALDKLNVVVKGAFWLLMQEHVWRLFVASPEARTVGPKALYRKIRSANSKVASPASTVSTADISVIDDKAPLYGLLRSTIQTGPGISGIRFSRNVINGQLIEDAYLYRLT